MRAPSVKTVTDVLYRVNGYKSYINKMHADVRSWGIGAGWPGPYEWHELPHLVTVVVMELEVVFLVHY